jgi:carbon-monoxide dehydrogenase large subunit
MPRADDLPSFKVDHSSCTPCPTIRWASRAAARPAPSARPPAVINAITDALGHEDIAMPATPQAVWRAAQKTLSRMAAE